MNGLKLMIVLIFVDKFSACRSANSMSLPEETRTRKSVTECIISAGRRYFTGTLVISLATRETNTSLHSAVTLHRILIPQLMKEKRWPTKIYNFSDVLFDQLITKPVVIDYSNRPVTKNYIIQLRDEDLTDTLTKLRQLGTWNPHAKFLVVTTYKKENVSEFALMIMKKLLKFSAINGILLVPDEQDALVYKVFTGFPYKSGNCGQDFNQIVLIDTCTFGISENNATWFPLKLPKVFNKCEIKVDVTIWPPYVINVENGSVGEKEDYFLDKGIEINILNMIAAKYNLRMRYSRFFNQKGVAHPNGTLTKSVKLLYEEKLDVLAGGYAKSLGRSQYFDDTHSYIQEYLHFCVPFKWKIIQSSLLTFMSFECWFLVITIYFMVTIINWYLEKMTFQNLLRNIQNSFGILIGIPVSLPILTKQRCFVILLIYLSLFLLSLYQTVLTSILADTSEVQEFGRLEDVFSNRLTTYFPQNTEKYFQYNQNEDNDYDSISRQIHENWNTCFNITKCIERIIVKKDAAICIQKHFMTYLQNVNDSKAYPHIYCFKKMITSYPVNLLMRKGFPLFILFNKFILRLSSSGFIEKWQKDLHSLSVFSTFDVDNDEYLGFNNLQPVFRIIFIGHFIAIVVFIIEVIVGRKSRQNNVRPTIP